MEFSHPNGVSIEQRWTLICSNLSQNHDAKDLTMRSISIPTNTDFKFYRRIINGNHGSLQKASIQLVFSSSQERLNKCNVFLGNLCDLIFDFSVQLGLELNQNPTTIAYTFTLKTTQTHLAIQTQAIVS